MEKEREEKNEEKGEEQSEEKVLVVHWGRYFSSRNVLSIISTSKVWKFLVIYSFSALFFIVFFYRKLEVGENFTSENSHFRFIHKRTCLSGIASLFCKI